MEFVNKVIAFFNHILEFINTGIYDFFTQVFAQFVIWATIAQIKFKIFMIQFAWDTAKQILQQLDISSQLNAAFASLDSNILGIIGFLNIPEALSIILSALVTKFVLRFMGY